MPIHVDSLYKPFDEDNWPIAPWTIAHTVVQGRHFHRNLVFLSLVQEPLMRASVKK